MNYSKKLEKYMELLNSNQVSFSSELSDLEKYFISLFKHLHMKNILGGVMSREGFESWVREEYNKIKQISDLLEIVEESSVSELDAHMQSFDNLGFDNMFVYTWHRDILRALERTNNKMSIYYSILMDNKQLLQYITGQINTYNYLNNKGLLNKGSCPITGEKISGIYYYEMFGRKIYLSQRGILKCKELD